MIDNLLGGGDDGVSGDSSADTEMDGGLFDGAESGDDLMDGGDDLMGGGDDLMGGEPKQPGELISQNMNQLAQLRERRRQVTVTLIGLLYGISAASAFAFFTGLEIAVIMSGFDIEVSSSQVDFGQLLHTEMYNVPLLRYLLFLVLLFNAVMSAITIRTADGGHYGNALLHFVALIWVGCLTALATETLISSLLEIDL